MKLFARTLEEADLYVDLECEAVGEVPKSRKKRTVERRRKPVLVYEIRCESGKLLEFEFEDGGLPDAKPGLRRKVEFGGASPSLLIDAGEWMKVADRHQAKAPKSVAGLSERARRDAKRDMQIAVAALQEVMKFLPAGADRVSSTSLLNARGKAYFNKDVRRFQRSALQAQLEDFQARLRRYESSRL